MLGSLSTLWVLGGVGIETQQKWPTDELIGARELRGWCCPSGISYDNLLALKDRSKEH